MANHIINNITDNYVHKHDAMESWNKIKNVVEEYGNQPFTFCDYYAKKIFLILNEPHKGKYIIEVPSWKK